MKKFYLLFLNLLIFYWAGIAQKPLIQLKWLNTAPSYYNGGEFSAQGVTNLSDGSVVVVGYFQHTVDFDPGPDTFNLTTTAYYGIFVAKYTNQGKLAFAYGFSESNTLFFDENYESANAVTTDADDNIYVTGTFRGTVDFDPDSGTTILSTGKILSNNFIACYTKNGKLKFAKDITRSNQDYAVANSIALDKHKNIYVCGMFDGSSNDFDPGPDSTNFSSAGGDDIFFAKYDSLGNYVFAKTIGGSLWDYVYKITLDSKSNILICGGFGSSSVDFDPGPSKRLLRRVSNEDMFFAKYDSAGNYILAKNVGNSKSNIAYGIAVGKDDAFALTGFFYGTSVDFDVVNSGTHVISSNGNQDAFIAKYDANGNCVLAFNIGNGSGYDGGVDIGTDSNNNIICTGEYGGSNVDFDPGSNVYNLKAGVSNNYYIAKYNQNGNFLSAVGLTGGRYVEDFKVSCLHITNTNKILAGGYYDDSFDANAGPDTALLTSPAQTMFVTKYDANENYLGVISGNNYYDYVSASTLVTSSAIDKKGNSYVCGNFDGRYDFDPGPNQYILTSSLDEYGDESANSFFAKYDKDGNLIFAKAISGGDNYTADMAVDNNGNIYLTGKATGTTDFDPGNSVYYLNNDSANTKGYYNYFFAKYDNKGNLLYAKGGGNQNSNFLKVTSIAIDTKNNVCIAGSLNGSIDFNPGSAKHILNGGIGLGNMFIAKYDSTGNYLFAYCIQSANSRGVINDLKFDNKNKIIFTGTFNGKNLDFDAGPGEFLLSSSFSGDVDAGFIATYKNNGAFIFAITIDGQDYSYSHFAYLTIDKNGNIDITGTSTNVADFDPGSNTAFLSQNGEMFFASYNNKLQFRFLKGIEGDGSYTLENSLNTITTDRYNNIYVAGQFQSKDIDCDAGPGKALLYNGYYNVGGNSNLFIAKYDSLGNYIYCNQFKTDSATGSNFSTSILVNDDGTIYYSGFTAGKVNFAIGSKKVYLQPTNNYGNIFIAQYQQTTVLSKVSNALTQSKNRISNQIKVYPNPMAGYLNIQLDDIKQNNATALISLYNINGKCLLTSKFNFTNYKLNTTITIPQNLSVGNYFIKIDIDGKSYYSDLLIK